jgi:ATP-dependent protease ClpP protease subunit
MRIEIRGVIVPSNWDTSWAKEYIEKGIIAPESAVRRAIAGAPVDGPLQVYINSPGGSVFSAYEIINTLAAWRANNGQPVEITIGAMAASAASAIAILSGAKLNVHRNSKLMFHGAWSETVGGAEAHGDTATLLEQINTDIKTALVSRYGVPAETVDEWFAEGRQGWLTAQDAIKYKMAESIVDADDEEIDYPETDISQIQDHGLAIAAMLPKMEDTPDDGGKPDVSADAGTGNAEPDAKPDDEPQPAAQEPAPARDVDAEVAQRVEIEIGARLAEHVAVVEDLKAKLTSTEKARAHEQGLKDKANADGAKAKQDFECRLAEMTEALKQANARVAKLTLGSLSFSPAIETWAEAMAACGGDYAKARKQYPDAYATFMQQTNKRK